jgi:hypothetical protein
VGPPSPSGLRGAWGQAAAAAPLGSVSWAAPGRAAAAAGERELTVVQGRARASAAAWAPLPALSRHQPREPPGLLAAKPEGPPGSPAPPPSALFYFSLLSPVAATPGALRYGNGAPIPLRVEAPGPQETRIPPASDAAPEGAPQPAGGRLRLLNGCVPLSHQVAGHR